MNGDGSIRFNSLEDFDVSFSDLDDSFADPDFILETVNNLSDSEFIFKRNHGLSDSDDLGGILCLDTDDECEKNKLDGPNIIEATDSSNSDEETINEVPTRNSKKRIANPSLWKRNVAKKHRAAGEEYTSIYTNKVVPKRVTGRACKCIYKCFSKITDTDKSSIINTFNAIGNKEKQDTFLCGLISVNNVQRRRPLVKGTPETKKSVSCTYKIRLTTNELIVCKIAFCSLFGIVIICMTNRQAKKVKMML